VPAVAGPKLAGTAVKDRTAAAALAALAARTAPAIADREAQNVGAQSRGHRACRRGDHGGGWGLPPRGGAAGLCGSGVRGGGGGPAGAAAHPPRQHAAQAGRGSGVAGPGGGLPGLPAVGTRHNAPAARAGAPGVPRAPAQRLALRQAPGPSPNPGRRELHSNRGAAVRGFFSGPAARGAAQSAVREPSLRLIACGGMAFGRYYWFGTVAVRHASLGPHPGSRREPSLSNTLERGVRVLRWGFADHLGLPSPFHGEGCLPQAGEVRPGAG
jgi:hypothetical protein